MGLLPGRDGALVAKKRWQCPECATLVSSFELEDVLPRTRAQRERWRGMPISRRWGISNDMVPVALIGDGSDYIDHAYYPRNHLGPRTQARQMAQGPRPLFPGKKFYYLDSQRVRELPPAVYVPPPGTNARRLEFLGLMR
jgi:hypothetical protein